MSKHSSLEQQLAGINARLGKIEKHMKWERVFAFMRLAVIAIPIVVAILVVPPFVKKYTPVVGAAIEKVQQTFMQFQQMSAKSVRR